MGGDGLGAEVAALMARIVAGDVTAPFELFELAAPALRRMVRARLSGFGRVDLLRDREEIEGLVLDAFLVVLDHARGWRPDAGALPWDWAQRAIHDAIARLIGHPRTGGDPDDHLCGLVVVSAPPVPAAVGGELLQLAAHHAEVRLLVEAAHVVGSERDVAVHVEYRTQMACGDPSPAHTVAAIHRLSPANVRQIDRRMRVRIGALAERDERYAPLARLAWISG